MKRWILRIYDSTGFLVQEQTFYIRKNANLVGRLLTDPSYGYLPDQYYYTITDRWRKRAQI